MRVFLDTTVLVAASERSHPHHVQALPVLQRIVDARDKGSISIHSIAELFAALTRLPVQPRIHPTEAVRIISTNVLPHFEVISIGKRQYLDALKVVSDGGWAGAKIYDVLILGCAEKSNAERIYTFNIGDFRQLASADLLDKICSP